MDKIKQIEDNTTKLLSYFSITKYENQSETKLLNSEAEAPFIKFESKDLIGDIVVTQNRFVTNKQKEQVIFRRKHNESFIELNPDGFELFDNTILLLNNIYSIRNISKEFLNENLFNWCFNIVSTNLYSISFYTFIDYQISLFTKEYQFAFIVNNIAIDEDIHFDNVKISFFKESNFKELSKDDISNFKNPDIGKIYITASVNGDEIQSENIAFKKCGYIIDILKLYHPAVYNVNFRCTTELKKRLDFQVVNNVFKLDSGAVIGHKISGLDDNYTLRLDDKTITLAKQSGLHSFADFVLKEAKTEFEELLILCIELYSRALSEYDLHIRAVQIVSIFETLFLKEDDSATPAKKRIVFYNHINNEKENPEQIFLMLFNFFQIRHSYIHKSKRIEINENEYSRVQVLLKHILLNLITSKYSHNNKSEFIDYLDTNGVLIYDIVNLYFDSNLRNKSKKN
jgi:hypothetical protein